MRRFLYVCSIQTPQLSSVLFVFFVVARANFECVSEGETSFSSIQYDSDKTVMVSIPNTSNFTELNCSYTFEVRPLFFPYRCIKTFDYSLFLTQTKTNTIRCYPFVTEVSGWKLWISVQSSQSHAPMALSRYGAFYDRRGNKRRFYGSRVYNYSLV